MALGISDHPEFAITGDFISCNTGAGHVRMQVKLGGKEIEEVTLAFFLEIEKSSAPPRASQEGKGR